MCAYMRSTKLFLNKQHTHLALLLLTDEASFSSERCTPAYTPYLDAF